jgi:2-hydroxychromene-2-carboxylate isomerase
MKATPAEAVFRYDFNSPYAYLAAARVDDVVGPEVRWQPIAFAFLLRAQERVPWSLAEGRADGIAECQRRATARGLPPMRWPEGWPQGSYSLDPLRAALVAEQEGLLRAYSDAAFRAVFVDGHNLGGEAAVDVAVAVGLDREATREAMGGWAKERLRAVTDEAIASGVPGVPTLTVGGTHFWGDDQLEDAALARDKA